MWEQTGKPFCQTLPAGPAPEEALPEASPKGYASVLEGFGGGGSGQLRAAGYLLGIGRHVVVGERGCFTSGRCAPSSPLTQ